MLHTSSSSGSGVGSGTSPLASLATKAARAFSRMDPLLSSSSLSLTPDRLVGRPFRLSTAARSVMQTPAMSPVLSTSASAIFLVWEDRKSILI